MMQGKRTVPKLWDIKWFTVLILSCCLSYVKCQTTASSNSTISIATTNSVNTILSTSFSSITNGQTTNTVASTNSVTSPSTILDTSFSSSASSPPPPLSSSPPPPLSSSTPPPSSPPPSLSSSSPPPPSLSSSPSSFSSISPTLSSLSASSPPPSSPPPSSLSTSFSPPSSSSISLSPSTSSNSLPFSTSITNTLSPSSASTSSPTINSSTATTLNTSSPNTASITSTQTIQSTTQGTTNQSATATITASTVFVSQNVSFNTTANVTEPTAITKEITMQVITTRGPPASTSAPVTMEPFISKYEFPFQMSFSTPFNTTLLDRNSLLYRTFSENITEELIVVYKDTPGFISVLVTGFKNGSTLVDYDLTVHSYVKQEDVINYINTTGVSNMQSVYTPLGMPYKIEEDLLSNIQQANQRYSNPCLTKDSCKPSYKCVNKICSLICTKNTCLNDGQCFSDSNSTSICKCSENWKYYYSGSKCEIENMSWKFISSIAGGICAAVVLIFLIIIVALCCKRKKGSEQGSDNFPLSRKTNGFEPEIMNAYVYDNKAMSNTEYDEATNYDLQQQNPTYCAQSEFRPNLSHIDTSKDYSIVRPKIGSRPSSVASNGHMYDVMDNKRRPY